MAIPDSVTSIGNYAFSGCSSLTSVTIPDSVTSIGNYAFYGCNSLSEVDVQDLASWCKIFFGDEYSNPCGYAKSLFVNGTKITDLVIPDTVTTIGAYAFRDCSDLTSVTIPSSVISIGSYAFSGCSGLTSVTIPDSVTSIGRGVFQVCTGLESVMIPESVTNIGSSAFYGCSGLISMTIPYSVVSIGYGAFNYCGRLLTLYLPRQFEGKTSSMQIPSECSVFFTDYVRLIVCSDFGHPIPERGTFVAVSNEVISCSVPNSIIATDEWRYVCTGWRGTGSAPSSGTSTNFSFIITEDSSIEWLWETNVWIECSFSGGAKAEVETSGWFLKDGADIEFYFQPSTQPFIYSLIGDTDGVWVNEAAGTIAIPTDRPRNVALHVVSRGEAAETGASKPLDWASTEARAAPWFVFSDCAEVDGFCLRSGEINANTNSVLEATIIGKGRLSFKWKISSGRGDFCKFFLDGVEQASITRSTAWQTVSLDIPAGEHTVRWCYERGSGSATGEDAAFLDDVDWRPEVALAVASAFGTATPDAGTHTFVYGDEVVASAVAPEPENGTRRVCTGWTGTGSAPAVGAESNVSFTITNDTSIVWNWRTDYLTGISVSGGSGDFGPQWVASGETVEVALSPAAQLYEISLSGDTEGVTLNGTTLRFVADRPRQINATITEVKVSLAVESEWGVPSPTNGVHVLSWGTLMSASVAEPEPTNGVLYVCTGWTGTGSVPESGTGTNIAFTIESDSSIRWNWQTNVWISIAANGPVGVDVADGWFALGEAVVAQYSPNVDFFTIALSGDTDGVVLDESARTIAIPADRPRSVTLSIAELTLKKALDAGSLTWGTSGNATWFPQIDVSADGVSSARSGGLSNGDEVSALETTVQGGGTFAWSWRLGVSGDSNSGVDVLLDGEWLDAYYPGTDWSRETLEITGDGTHTIRFEFWNAGTETGDCAYLDQVSWSGGVPSHDIVIGNVRIPSDWIEEKAASALARADGDHEAAANATAANGINKVWECYVAGISPTDETARFEATIEIVDGKPVVRWNPPLSAEEEAKRTRKILGRRSLDDSEGWQDVSSLDDPEAAGYRFFKVSVEMK